MKIGAVIRVSVDVYPCNSLRNNLPVKEMMGRSLFDDANGVLYPSAQPPIHRSGTLKNGSGRNVFSLLAQRETSPRTKCTPRRQWGMLRNRMLNFLLGPEVEQCVMQGVAFFHVEAELFLHLSAKYCPLVPPPRSTIAAAFSPDGKTLASTHVDHTMKVIDCQTGSCLKVLSGHRRTPWVVWLFEDNCSQHRGFQFDRSGIKIRQWTSVTEIYNFTEVIFHGGEDYKFIMMIDHQYPLGGLCASPLVFMFYDLKRKTIKSRASMVIQINETVNTAAMLLTRGR